MPRAEWYNEYKVTLPDPYQRRPLVGKAYHIHDVEMLSDVSSIPYIELVL